MKVPALLFDLGQVACQLWSLGCPSFTTGGVGASVQLCSPLLSQVRQITACSMTSHPMWNKSLTPSLTVRRLRASLTLPSSQPTPTPLCSVLAPPTGASAVPLGHHALSCLRDFALCLQCFSPMCPKTDFYPSRLS